ncbi:hypothetical protein B0H19DRAFT_1074752 [Mycena capillaripes]|nr:hypothetical protein B0H19DRAFT_1074752 [Mycena capillaripes]
MYLSNENPPHELSFAEIYLVGASVGGTLGRQGAAMWRQRAAVGAAQGVKRASPGASRLRAGGGSPNVGGGSGGPTSFDISGCLDALERRSRRRMSGPLPIRSLLLSRQNCEDIDESEEAIAVDEDEDSTPMPLGIKASIRKVGSYFESDSRRSIESSAPPAVVQHPVAAKCSCVGPHAHTRRQDPLAINAPNDEYGTGLSGILQALLTICGYG